MAVPWTDVGELRVEARGNRPPRLVLADVRGTRWTVALAARSGGGRAVRARYRGRATSGRACPRAPGVPGWCASSSSCSARSSLLAFQWSSALLVAVRWPCSCRVRRRSWPAPSRPIAAGLLAAGARRHRPSESYWRSSWRWRGLGRFRGVAMAPRGWAGRSHRSPDRGSVGRRSRGQPSCCTAGWTRSPCTSPRRAVPALVVLPLATAAAWAWAREPRFRRGVMVPLLLGAIGVAVSTTAWLDLVVRRSAARCRCGHARDPVTLTAVDRAEVDASAAQLWLSPVGTHVCDRARAAVDDEDEESVPLEFTIGRLPGRVTPYPGTRDPGARRRGGGHPRAAGEQLAVRTRLVTAPATPTWSVIVSRNGLGHAGRRAGRPQWRWAHIEAAGVRTYSGLLGSPEVGERFAGGRDPRGYTQWLTTDEAPLGISASTTAERGNPP